MAWGRNTTLVDAKQLLDCLRMEPDDFVDPFSATCQHFQLSCEILYFSHSMDILYTEDESQWLQWSLDSLVATLWGGFRSNFLTTVGLITIEFGRHFDYLSIIAPSSVQNVNLPMLRFMSTYYHQPWMNLCLMLIRIFKNANKPPGNGWHGKRYTCYQHVNMVIVSMLESLL